MNKKYTIVNANSQNSCVDYFFYIIIFILLIYLCINIITNNNYRNILTNIHERFDMMNMLPASSCSSSNEYKRENEMLKENEKMLQDTLKKKERAIFLSKKYNKVAEKSIDNEIDFINTYMQKTVLPTDSFDNKIIVTNEQQLNNLINQTKMFKNIYKVGDRVTTNSDFKINKDDICYNDHQDKILKDPNFKQKYPSCMVCNINPEKSYKNTKSWENTKTNIHKVCLFNDNAQPHTDVLTYDGCAKMCQK